MIKILPDGAHIPRDIQLKAVKCSGDSDGLISRIGYGYLTVYRNSLGTRKLCLNNDDIRVYVNGVIYKMVTQLQTSDWYILKTWGRDSDDNLRLRTYAINDVNGVAPINLMEIY